ncbi:hypothetical protein FGIG_01529 [Fasciola gigantica]|uniref:Uncharacterized protein n=1 Tax=Fasciola gigantica TaxID=46835 RepID=A0A504YPP3_FASGI|nr:hypothetical protein FGIG_01529 [Fasciola gigantica]
MRDCRAEFYCYTVYQMARPPPTHPKDAAKSLTSLGHLMADSPEARMVLTRGCVANGMIHMCDKRERQPNNSGATHLITQCCRDAWCNSDRQSLKNMRILDNDADLAENKLKSFRSNKTSVPYLGYPKFPNGRSRGLSGSGLDNLFEARKRDMLVTGMGSESTGTDSLSINHGPSYPIDETRDRRSNIQNRLLSSSSTSPSQYDWTALFTRPMFIVLIVTFVLLVCTGLIFVTAFSVCRRHRPHRKPRSHSMTTYSNTSQPYEDKERNKHEVGANPVKFSPSSWTPSAVIYQPSRSEFWACCCPRVKPDSLYDYCRQESFRPNECGTSDSLVERSPKDPEHGMNSNPNSSKNAHNLRHALIRGTPVVPTEQKTSVWIEKQQQQMARLPPPPPPSSTGQFSASLSPGSSVEFSYPRRLVDNSSTPGASAQTSVGCPTKPWPTDSVSGPDESLEAIVTDGQLWTVYSGPSLDTENSEGRDEQSECTELSSNPSRPPLPQKLPRNMFIMGDKPSGGTAVTGSKTAVPPFSSSFRKPPHMIEYQRQRGTGATSSGGEESRPGLSEFSDWPRRPETHSASSQSEHSDQKVMLNSNMEPLFTPETNGPQSSNGLNRQPSANLIALTNFRKADDNRPELATPYAQFQLSPEPSMLNFK